MKSKRLSFLFLLILTQLMVCEVADAQETNQLTVLRRWAAHDNASNALYDHLLKQSTEMLQQRQEEVAQITTLSQWKERQAMVQKKLLEIAGPFPERSPLNARVTRTIRKNNYRVEHIIYESRPGFFVTGSLFIPAGATKRKKAPVVIYCSGHGASAYRGSTYLSIATNLVNKGFAVFAFDPVGQGERLEYADPATGESIVGAPTREHAYPGAQLFLTGNSLASFMIWDGIRAVDYLLTRPEIDGARIGITGRSGGGTQSAYIAACDPRIYAAAPEGYITTFSRLLESIGPQDAEQDIHRIVAEGLDHADFLAVRAPKPAMMITTTNDFFNITGSKETEAEVKKIYDAYGAADNFSRVEDMGPHTSTRANREAMYAFFQKHLKNPGSTTDEELELLTPEELVVTDKGQLGLSAMPGETTYALNKKYMAQLESGRASQRSNMTEYLRATVDAAKDISGFQQPARVEKPVLTGVLPRKTYRIKKCFIKGEGEYVIPYLRFIPATPTDRVVLYMRPQGKLESASAEEVQGFLNAGYEVIAPDLIGQGEMGKGLFDKPDYFKHVKMDGLSYIAMNWGVLVGRSVVGIRAGDLVRLVQMIKRDNGDAKIYALSVEGTASELLHAAAFEPGISGVALISPFVSFASIVKERFYQPDFVEHGVPGALAAYDLPDLAGSLAPAKLLIFNPTDGTGKSYGPDPVESDLAVIRKAYDAKRAANNLKIVFQKTPLPSADIIKFFE